MLILHFLGLAMGVGTGFAMMFLGIAASKLDEASATQFMGRSMVLSNMGKLGLVFMIATGFVLIGDRWDILMANTYFQIKLGGVLLLTVLIGIMDVHARNLRKGGDPGVYLKKIGTLGRVTLPLGILIVVMAVLVFH